MSGPQYQKQPSLVDSIGQFAPIMTSIMAMLRPMLEGSIKEAIGASPWDMRSPLAQRRAPNYFTGADSEDTAPWRSAFRHSMGMGIRGDSVFGGAMADASREFAQNLTEGSRAFERALRSMGGGRSIAASSLGMPVGLSEHYGLTTSPADLVASFADIGQMKGGALSVGHRQVLLERMLRSDRGMLSGYSADMTALSGKTTEDALGQLYFTDDSKADAASEKILRRVNELRQNVRRMDMAVAAWQDVLNTDVDGALKAITQLFGGDVTATFSGQGDTLQEAALRVKHTAALTGSSTGFMMSGTAALSKAIGAFKGPQETALTAALFTANYSAGLGGYRGSQADMEQYTALSSAHAVTSPYGTMLAGGYARYMSSAEGSALGYGPEGMAAYRRLLEEKRPEDGTWTAEALNKALSTVGVDAASEAEYIRYGGSEAGRDFMRNDDFVFDETTRAANAAARRTLESRITGMAEMKELVGEGTLYRAMSSSPEERNRLLREKLVDNPEGLARMRQLLLDADLQTTEARDHRAAGLERFSPNMSSAAIWRSISPETEKRAAARRAETEARTALDLNQARSGSYLQGAIDLLGQNLTEGTPLDLGGLVRAMTGVSDADYQLFADLGGGGQEGAKAFKTALEGARKKLKDRGVDEKALLKDLFREYQNALDTGDNARISLARKDIVGLLGGGFDAAGRYTFDGEDTGTTSIDEIIQGSRSRRDLTGLKRDLYSSAASFGDETRRAAIRAAMVKGKVNLWAAGMSSEEIDRAVVMTSASRMVAELKSREASLVGYTEKDGQYVKDGASISAGKYRELQDEVAVRKRLSALMEPGWAESEESLGEAKKLITRTRSGTEEYEQAQRLAGLDTPEMSLQRILPEIIRSIAGSVIFNVKDVGP
jgi:hypothetical protein